MEAAGLAVATFTSIKEVYLLSRFICRIIHSRNHADTQRHTLCQDFEFEILFLQSLCLMLRRVKGIFGEQALETEWVEQIRGILERLRQTCCDYSRIAAESDPDYKMHSPFVNQDDNGQKLLDFDNLSPINQNPPNLPKSTKDESGLFSSSFKWPWKKSSSFNHAVLSWRWALFERRKLEHVVDKFQKQNRKMKELLPLMIMAMLMKQAPQRADTLKKLIDHDEEDRLGLASHARLQQLVVDPSADSTDFELQNVQLEAPEERFSLVLGNLSQSKWPGAVKERVLVEYKDFDPSLDESLQADRRRRIHQLASLLSSSGTNDLHTLKPRGYLCQSELNRFAFVFDFPEGVRKEPPVTLYTLISKEGRSSSLSLPERFLIAETLARTLGAFHADGWVHKSIRSRSVIFFQNKNKDCFSVCNPYLANFEYSRPETAETNLSYDEDIEMNLYRHPDRQGPPKISFSKLHDIYALGVVLLEIGLWRTATKIFNDACKKLKPGAKPNSRGIRNIFHGAAAGQLSHYMGPAYMKAVVACLSDEFKDLTSSSKFPRLFYEKVIRGVEGRTMFKLE